MTDRLNLPGTLKYLRLFNMVDLASIVTPSKPSYYRSKLICGICVAMILANSKLIRHRARMRVVNEDSDGNDRILPNPITEPVFGIVGFHDKSRHCKWVIFAKM